MVFEVTLDFPALTPFGASNPLTLDEEGIFLVNADGSGLRQLGPASLESGALVAVGISVGV